MHRYLEIYNEAIADLLRPEANQLQLREHHKRGCHVEGLSEVSVLNCKSQKKGLKRSW